MAADPEQTLITVNFPHIFCAESIKTWLFFTISAESVLASLHAFTNIKHWCCFTHYKRWNVGQLIINCRPGPGPLILKRGLTYINLGLVVCVHCASIRHCWSNLESSTINTNYELERKLARVFVTIMYSQYLIKHIRVFVSTISLKRGGKSSSMCHVIIECLILLKLKNIKNLCQSI